MGLKKTLINIVCGLVPGRQTRSRVRVVLNNPKQVHEYVDFVREWANKNCGGVHKMSLEFGVGCHNLVVLLNDQHAFKFSLVNRPSRGPREKRITDALRTISPIHLPEMETFEWNNTIVRRYEFIHGKLISEFDPKFINQNREKIAKQLANCMFAVGRADPEAIRDLKPTKNAKPDYLYGWFHNDLGNNFIMDDDLNIVAFIDNEKAEFCDFKEGLSLTSHFWDKLGIRGLMVATLAEYSKLYYGNR